MEEHTTIEINVIKEQQQQWMTMLQETNANIEVATQQLQKLQQNVLTLEGAIQACSMFIEKASEHGN